MSENLNNNLLEPFKELFEQEKYDEALKTLKNLKAQTDPGLYEYNIGSVYFAKKDYYRARKNFELAKKNGFYTNETKNGLEKSKEYLEVSSLEEAEDFQETIERELITSSIDVFITVSLILLLLSFISKFHKSVRALFFLLAFAPVSFYAFQSGKFSRVIANEEISILKGPSKMFEVVQILPQGMVFITKDKVEGWVKVVYPKSHSGWIKDKSMESL